MSYATTTELKSYLDVAGSADDALLTRLLERASVAIDSYTHRSFAAALATSYYSSDRVDGDLLTLDGDLFSVTTLKNGEGNTIASTDYWLLPRNIGPPYQAIKLKAEADYSWTFDTDGEIEVYGLWGYSSDPPDDIVHACLRLAGYYYRQKDAQTFDVTALPDQGIITIPKGLPADVKQLLDPYKRLGVA
jgi:hypothetical protein